MGKGMKNFTYYDDNKKSLCIDNCNWLKLTGLKETQWFLDTAWLIKRTIFKEWIGE